MLVNVIFSLSLCFIITVILNIILGLFYNIGILNEKFSKKQLLLGFTKVIMIAISFVCWAFILEHLGFAMTLGNYLIGPDLILYGIIVVYIGKAFINLKNILCTNNSTKFLKR